MRHSVMTAGALSLLPLASFAQVPNDTVFRAMRAELARSMAELRLDTLPKPYFVAYRVQELEFTRVSASLGSLLESEESRHRGLTVDVRVGDYSFDNTNFLGLPTGGPSGLLRGLGGAMELPLDDDYRALRRALWLATDGAYKQAVEQLSQKRAALENLANPDRLPDLTREDISSIVDTVPLPKINRAQVESLVRGWSALFRAMPDIYRSRVDWSATLTRTRYVNSEGTSFVRTSPSITVRVQASTQATDGMPLGDTFSVYAASPPELPSRDVLAAAVQEFGARLAQLRTAHAADAYSGPVLFEGQAAAELFNQVFAPRLLASRRPVTDNPMFGHFASEADNPFLDQVGARVLPRFLSAVANPTITAYQGTFVGGYRVDDDGVPARETKLVDHGVLKTLLSTRVPVHGISKSTGSRWGSGPVVSNLIVTADSGVSAAELKRELLKLAAARGGDYAIVVRRIENPTLSSLEDPSALMAFMAGPFSRTPSLRAVLAVKLYQDGHEELIRNAEISGITPETFKDIVAASQSLTVHPGPFQAEAPFPSGGAGTFIGARSSRLGYEASYVVPSLLFESVSLRRPSGEPSKPPLAPPPWASGR